MCLANDFAALSAPCVRCVRVRLHITTFPFHISRWFFLSVTFILYLNLSFF